MKRTNIGAALLVIGIVFALREPARSDQMSELYANLTYRPIGPAISGGRITATTGSDHDAQLYYIGGADGGVFKSTNGGASWFPVFDSQPVAAIGALALDERDPNTLWVGTGEANPRNDAAMGDGVFVTHDGGKSWTHAGLSDAGAISSISIDPSNSRTIVVGVLGQEFRDSSTRGIYRSTDNGAHWSQRLFVGPATGVCDIVRLPRKPQTLFAGLWEYRRKPWTMTSGGPQGGIYRSDDGGQSWRRLAGNGLPSGLTGRIGLAASGNMLYARIQSKEGFIWRSQDGGRHWQRMPPSEFVGGRGFYFSRVFADPSNPQRILSLEGVAAMSTNGARSFEQTALVTGYDFHYAWWSSDGRRLVLGSDEGLVMSGDGGEHWVQPYDLPFAQVYHVGFDRVLPYYHVCIGLQDNNSWCAPSSVPNTVGVLNRDWLTVAPGDGMWSVFDPQNENLLWSSETNTSSGQVFLTDFRSWQQRFVAPSARLIFATPASAQHYRFNWDTPIAFTTGAKPQTLVGGNVLFSSSDGGQTWAMISPDLTRDDTSKQGPSGGPIQLDMSDAEDYDTIMYAATTPLDGGVIWVGTDDGVVQLTRDSGAHWHNVTPPGMPAWARVMGMDVGHGAAGTVYVAADGHMSGDISPHVFASDDFGSSWHSISGDLPANLYVMSIREDPKNAQLLYAGTQRGVWISFDRGVHWHSLRLNMPATAVYDLEIQPDRNDLVVGSHGRGVWILDDLTPLQRLGGVQAQAAAIFDPRPAYRMFAVSPITTSLYGPVVAVPDNIFVGQNAPTGAIISYYVRQSQGQSSTIDVSDSGGHIMRHLKGSASSNHPGINRISWNLTEDGPVPWNNSINKNIEPVDGAEVLPGNYTVTLHSGGQTLNTALIVKQDPRDPSTPAQYQQRYDMLHQLFGELSSIDTMLNAIDKQHPPSAALQAFKYELTSAPDFDEDNISRAPQIRDRILDLIGQFSTSFAAPTAPQIEEAATLKQQYEALAARYQKLR